MLGLRRSLHHRNNAQNFFERSGRKHQFLGHIRKHITFSVIQNPIGHRNTGRKTESRFAQGWRQCVDAPINDLIRTILDEIVHDRVGHIVQNICAQTRKDRTERN